MCVSAQAIEGNTLLLTTLQFSDAKWGTVSLHSDGNTTLVEPHGSRQHCIVRYNCAKNQLETVYLHEKSRRIVQHRSRKFIFIVCVFEEDDTIVNLYPNGNTSVKYDGVWVHTVLRTGFRRVNFMDRLERVLPSVPVTHTTNEEHRAHVYTSSTNVVCVKKYDGSLVTLHCDGTRILRTSDGKFRVEKSDMIAVEISFEGLGVVQVSLESTILRCVVDQELCLRRPDDFYIRVDHTHQITIVETALISLPEGTTIYKGEGVYVIDHLYGGLRVLESDGSTCTVDSSGYTTVRAHDELDAHHPQGDADVLQDTVSALGDSLGRQRSSPTPVACAFLDEVKAVMAHAYEQYAQAKKVNSLLPHPPNLTLPLAQRLNLWQRRVAVQGFKRHTGKVIADSNASRASAAVTVKTTTPTNLRECIAVGRDRQKSPYIPFLFSLSPVDGICRMLSHNDILPMVCRGTKEDSGTSITEDAISGEPTVLQLSFCTRTVPPVVGDTSRGNKGSLVLTQFPPFLLPRVPAMAVPRTELRQMIRHTPLKPEQRLTLEKVLALNAHMVQIKSRYLQAMAVSDTRPVTEVEACNDVQRKFKTFLENYRLMPLQAPQIPTETLVPIEPKPKPNMKKSAPHPLGRSGTNMLASLSSTSALDASPLFRVEPAEVQFGVLKPGFKYMTSVKIINISERELHFRVQRSQSKYLQVDYSKAPIPMHKEAIVRFCLSVPKGATSLGHVPGQVDDTVDVVKFENAGAKKLGLGAVTVLLRMRLASDSSTLSQVIAPHVQVVCTVE